MSCLQLSRVYSSGRLQAARCHVMLQYDNSGCFCGHVTRNQQVTCIIDYCTIKFQTQVNLVILSHHSCIIAAVSANLIVSKRVDVVVQVR